ncbi:hypothetical protein [Pandoravirus japonicus]|uniref:F-box domain containing protein n=1 Tax=Pandoravirus japonicus TaxID=2823154 RepID=A0A811BRL9_9VIRU|nr:hypothetical protein [Pandoravirus japonicus]
MIGSLSTLGDDCLVHMLGFLPRCDYMALALASKSAAALLVGDGVLRAAWGPRVGAAGRFDPRFGPHQCAPATDDPQVAWTVPRSWRAASWLVDACRHSAATLEYLKDANNNSNARGDKQQRLDVIRAIEPPPHEAYVLKVHRHVTERAKFRSWLAVWELRWRASLDAHAGAAMQVLVGMLAPLLYLTRVDAVVPLSSDAWRDLDRCLGAGFYGAGAYSAFGHDPKPRPTDSIIVHVERCIPSWRSTMNITALATMAFSRASDVEGALSTMVARGNGIAYAMYGVVDDWNGALGSDLAGAHTDTWRDAITYTLLRRNAVRNSVCSDGMRAMLDGLVPRTRRRRAAALWAWCADAFGEFASPHGDNSDEVFPLWAENYERHGERGRNAFFAAMTAATASAVLAKTADADVPLVPDLTGLPDGHAFASSAAATASIALWEHTVHTDVHSALTNMTKVLEERVHRNVDFDAEVLADAVAAWDERTPTHAGHKEQARIAQARLVLLLWAMEGGAAGARRLFSVTGSHTNAQRLLSADACRDLILVVTGDAIKAAHALGAACSTHYTYNQSSLLAHAHASTFARVPIHPTDRLAPQGRRADIDEPRADLGLAIAALARTADALAWCLGPDADLDAATTQRVCDALSHVKATHAYMSTLIAPPSPNA